MDRKQPTDLEFAIYISRASESYSDASLRKWSNTFAMNNARLNVTGLLLTIGDHFVQMIEGERATILTMLKTIQADSRHTDFRLLHLRSANNRSFAEWAMRWISLDEKLYLGFDEMVNLRDRVRQLVGCDNAQKDDFSALIRSIPALLSKYQLA